MGFSFTEHATVEGANERLQTRCVNNCRMRLSPPDKTGAVLHDEERYARQCRELGIKNVYLFPESGHESSESTAVETGGAHHAD